MDKRKIGDTLKSARKLLGYTQKEVADKVGITQSRYSNYENGYSKPPIDLFIDLANKLGINYHDYIDGWGNYYSDKEFKEEFVEGYNNDIEQLMFSHQLYDFRNYIDKIIDLKLRRRIANDFSLYLNTLDNFGSFLTKNYKNIFDTKDIDFEAVKENFIKKLNDINEEIINTMIEVQETHNLDI